MASGIDHVKPDDGPPKGSDVVKALASQIVGKTILTTGVSPGGLGASFLATIADANPGLLILAGRSPQKVQQTADEITKSHPNIKTKTLALDLNSQKAVRAAANEVLSWSDVPHIDVLVLNAGIMGVPFKTTEDGLESQFGSNYVGHWLFSNLVIPKVLKGANGGRVVSVASDGARLDCIRFNDYGFSGGETYNPWRAYGQSKTGNCLYALSLAQKLGSRGLVAASVHPGVISTNLSGHLDGDFDGLRELDKVLGNTKNTGFKRISADQGVATHIFTAFSAEVAQYNGRYFTEAAVVPPEEVWSWARDPVDAEKLWKLTEELVGQKFDF